MGSDQSVTEFPEQQRINHSKFKKIKFVNDNQILRTCIPVESEQEVLNWDTKLKDVSDCDDQYLMLPKSYTYSKKAVCGTSGIVDIDFDNYPYLLKDQVENRRPNHNHFTQTELWYLIYGLASSTFIFKALESKVGDIRPQNIFINQCGQIRIANLCSWPSQRTNYEKTIFEQQLTYISPEEVEDSKQGKTHVYHDKYVSQSFSVGVTLLECGMLRSSSELYDQKKKSFNYQQLRKRIQRWFQLQMIGEQGHKQRYSWPLKLTIASLCEVNPKERFSCESLYRWLSPYDAEISNLRSVKLGMPPIKNLEKYQQLMGAGNKLPSNITPQKNSPFISKFQENRDYQTPQQRSYSPLSHSHQRVIFSQYVHPSEPINPNIIVHSHHPPPQKLYGHMPIEIRGKPQPIPSYIDQKYNEPRKPSIINGNQKNYSPHEQYKSTFTFNYLPPVEGTHPAISEKNTSSLQGLYKTQTQTQTPQYSGPNTIRESFGNVSSIEKRRDSGDRNDEASDDFLKKINENIQRSQQKFPGYTPI